MLSFDKIKSFFTNIKEETLREKIKKAIIEAQRRERERCDAEWTRKMQEREDAMVREQEFTLAEKDAEMFQLIKRNSELEDQIRSSQLAYQMYSEQAIMLKRLDSEIGHQVDRLFDRTGDVYQAFHNIQDSVKEHSVKYINDDSKIRNLLGMKERKELK